MNSDFIELDWLKRWNQYSPKREAIHDLQSDVALTYGDLFHVSNHLARHLKSEFQISQGDRVAILSKNTWAHIALFFAVHRLGAVLVPINFRLTPREVSHILGDSEPKLLLYASEFSGLLSEFSSGTGAKLWPVEAATEFLQSHSENSDLIDVAGAPEDLAMILYTSGTTGAPKGAMITRKMIFWNSLNTTMRLNLTQDDVHISFLPFFHTGGWNVLVTPFLHRGARTLLLEKFDPELILKLIAKERVTILFGVPTMLDMMAKSPAFANADLRTVRYAVVGGEPMPIGLIHTWQKRGVPIRQGYGLTEFGPNVFSLNEEDSERKIGSIGFPNFYIEAKIIDDQGRELGPGDIGELALRGPMCTPGYWRNERATRETLRDGWLLTGDLVRRDSEGYYYVVGRKKDMYISGGENVYPPEVEQFLRTHPRLADAAVIGVADEKWGEVGKAFLVPRPGQTVSAAEILEFCRGQIAKYKTPKYVQFVNELPKGDSGKILKRALADL